MRLAVAAGVLVACCGAEAHSPAHASALRALKGAGAGVVKDATWTSKTMLKVGVLDNGTSRDGFAQYVCEEVRAARVAGDVRVQVIDIAKLVRTDKWVKLGEARCALRK